MWRDRCVPRSWGTSGIKNHSGVVLQAALAKLGEMAAVVAHEVKKPLAGIRGAIQVFGERMTRAGTDGQILKEIVARIDSLDQMMKDLLLFSRPPKPRRSSVDLGPLVTATASLLSQDPSLQDVDLEINGTAPPVMADPEMLRIVFQNLVIFTPFFTTKSRGSGLGLPTAKRLIEAHHGQIDLTCPPEGGTQGSSGCR